MLITILSTIVVLGVLILVHELGHFWAAKAVDIEVSRFSIGFGPKIAGFRRGETEYVLAAIPLGGYVKMEGMVGEEAVSPLEGKTEPEREPSPRDFDAKPLWARFLVIVAGVVMNFVFAFAAFTFVARSEGVIDPLIGRLEPGSPAEQAGFQPSDMILAMDGRGIRNWDEVQQYVGMRPEVPIRFTVRRESEKLDIEATPGKFRAYNDLVKDSVDVGFLGIEVGLDRAQRDLTLPESLAAGWHRTGAWTGEIVSFLKRVVTGRGSAKELGGPIVIGQLSGAAAREGLTAFLNFMAIISVNLAVLNLLPIPVLDGGHLVFLLAEGLRGGRPMSVRSRLRLTQVGLILVMGLMVLAFANDIMRLVGI
ncbi:MAG: RIP metalloprotease RseP [Candidatus Palauibacterales bacterium]|nr:RIP metalloprotease RseP [Candidatus Palauibacterales bacterium]